jgi:hypothetical protein
VSLHPQVLQETKIKLSIRNTHQARVYFAPLTGINKPLPYTCTSFPRSLLTAPPSNLRSPTHSLLIAQQVHHLSPVHISTHNTISRQTSYYSTIDPKEMAGPKKSAAPAPIPETLSTSHPGITPALSMHVPGRAEPVASTIPSSQSPSIASSVALTRHTARAQDITQSITSMTQPTITAKDRPTGISASRWAGEAAEGVANISPSNTENNQPSTMKRGRSTGEFDTKEALRQKNRHALNFANALGLKLNSDGRLRGENSARTIRGNGNSEREGRDMRREDRGNKNSTASASRDNKRQDHQPRSCEALGSPPETKKSTGKVVNKTNETDRQGHGRHAQGKVPLTPKDGSNRSESGQKDGPRHGQKNNFKTPKVISTPAAEGARAPRSGRADPREAAVSRGITDKSALTNLTAESKRSSDGNGVTNEQSPSQKPVGLGTSRFARRESPPPRGRDDNTDTTSRHPNQTFTFQELRDTTCQPTFATLPSYVNRLPITTPPPPSSSTPVSSPAVSIGYMPNPTCPEFVPSASVTRTMTPTSSAGYDASAEFSPSFSVTANMSPRINTDQSASSESVPSTSTAANIPHTSNTKQNASPESVPSVSPTTNMTPASSTEPIASSEWAAEQDALRAERQRDRERYEEITRSALETLRKFA